MRRGIRELRVEVFIGVDAAAAPDTPKPSSLSDLPGYIRGDCSAEAVLVVGDHEVSRIRPLLHGRQRGEDHSFSQDRYPPVPGKLPLCVARKLRDDVYRTVRCRRDSGVDGH